MPLTRRQMMQLGGVIVGGWAVSAVLKRAAPIGRDVGESGALAAIFDDKGSPGSGPEDASLRLTVFTDYRCPACRRAFPAMEGAVRADGDVRIIYKDWPIFGHHRNGQHGSRARASSRAFIQQSTGD